VKLLKTYCIFCKTGKEKIVADNINILIDGAQAIVYLGLKGEAMPKRSFYCNYEVK
jgi:hypothetical protein